jgi:choline dehydrogenase-like flavoprotein
MIPLLPGDMDSHSAGWVPAWGPTYIRLMRQLPSIEKKFSLPPGPFEDDEIIGSGDPAAEAFVARFAKWPPFPLRNVASVFQSMLQSTNGPNVWLNAHLTKFSFEPSGRVDGAVAESLGGKQLHVSAREIIVAAGAIESTRLLLLADRQCDERIFAADNVLGRFLSDHLSAPIADLYPRSRKMLNRVVGFRFENGGMRNLRFEMRRATRLALQLPASFTHIAYESGVEGGFEALRDLLRAIQRGQRPKSSDIFAIVRDAPWLVRAVWWRYALGRLLYPSGGTITAHLNIEQKPTQENRITLSDGKADPFGLPLAKLHWRVGNDDMTLFHRVAEQFFRMWRASRLEHLAEIAPRNPVEWQSALRDGGGVYHPTGTIRIGTDATNGVVNSDLQTFRVPNLHVVSTATFPVAGGANPTLTMMLYGCDLAERLAHRKF